MSGSICQMNFASSLPGEESGRLSVASSGGGPEREGGAGRQAARQGGRSFLFAINSRGERGESRPLGGQAADAAAIPATTITNVAGEEALCRVHFPELWCSTVGRSGALWASWKRARESIFRLTFAAGVSFLHNLTEPTFRS